MYIVEKNTKKYIMQFFKRQMEVDAYSKREKDL